MLLEVHLRLADGGLGGPDLGLCEVPLALRLDELRLGDRLLGAEALGALEGVLGQASLGLVAARLASACRRVARATPSSSESSRAPCFTSCPRFTAIRTSVPPTAAPSGADWRATSVPVTFTRGA